MPKQVERVRRVRRVAHRGDSAGFPENTFPAYDSALRSGVEAIELDVQLSRDGVAVIFHDATLAAVGRPGGKVKDLDAAEILELDASRGREPSGCRIPTLGQVLAGYAKKILLLIEIKLYDEDPLHREALIRTVFEEIDRQKLQGCCEILCFELDPFVVMAAEGRPERGVVNLHAGAIPVIPLHCVGSISAFDLDIATAQPGTVEAIRQLDRDLYFWGCDDEAQLARARAFGADAVMSDHPKWLAEQAGSS